MSVERLAAALRETATFLLLLVGVFFLSGCRPSAEEFAQCQLAVNIADPKYNIENENGWHQAIYDICLANKGYKYVETSPTICKTSRIPNCYRADW